MAFTVTARHSGNNGTTASQTFATGSATPSASSLFLAAFVAQNNAHSTVPSLQTPTGGGYTYSLVGKAGESPTIPWVADSTFLLSGGMWRADVSASPAAHTVTVDAYSGTQLAFYAAVCCDITGHSSSTPAQTKAGGASVNPISDTASGALTLDSTPAIGSLVVVYFGTGADGAGNPATPTAGAGKSFTPITITGTATAVFGAMFYRVWDGTESNTITCADLGQQVGNWIAVAVEIAGDAAGLSVGPIVTPPPMSGVPNMGPGLPVFADPNIGDTTIATTTVVDSGLIAMVGGNQLSVTGQQDIPATVGMAGANALSVTGQQEIPSALSMAGSNVLTVSGLQTISATLAMAGANTLSVVADVGTQIAMAGSNSLTVTPLVIHPFAVTMAGSNSLSVSGLQTISATVTMAGANSLSVSGLQTISATVTMAGANTLSVSGLLTKAATIAIAGSNTLAITSLIIHDLIVSLAGSNALSVSGRQTIPATVTMAGINVLTVAVAGQQSATIAMAGSNSLAIAATVAQAATFAHTGTNSLAVTSLVTHPFAVALAGSNSLTVVGRQAIAAALTFVGSNTLGALADVGAQVASVLTGQFGNPRFVGSFGDLRLSAALGQRLIGQLGATRLTGRLGSSRLEGSFQQ